MDQDQQTFDLRKVRTLHSIDASPWFEDQNRAFWLEWDHPVKRPQQFSQIVSWSEGILRGKLLPKLQFGTNENWFSNIVPRQLPSLIISANKFAARHSLRGFDPDEFVK